MRQAIQLLAPSAAATSDATIATTSATGVTIIRMINVANTTNGALTFGLAIGGTTATAANLITGGAVQPIPANSVIQIYGPFVCPASTQIHGVASAVTVTFEISAELSVAGG